MTDRLSPTRPIVHGPLTFAAPLVWEDETMVVLAGPPVEGFRTNVVLKTRQRLKATSLRELCEEERTRLEARKPAEVTIVSHGIEELGGRGYAVLHAVAAVAGPPAVTVLQDQYSFPVDRRIITVTSSCVASAEPTVRPMVLALLASLTVA